METTGCVEGCVDMGTGLMDELDIRPESELQSTPAVHYGEAPRAAASFNIALHPTGARTYLPVVSQSDAQRPFARSKTSFRWRVVN